MIILVKTKGIRYRTNDGAKKGGPIIIPYPKYIALMIVCFFFTFMYSLLNLKSLMFCKFIVEITLSGLDGKPKRKRNRLFKRSKRSEEIQKIGHILNCAKKTLIKE